MRFLPLVLLVGCLKIQPKTTGDAMCFGLAAFQTGVGVVAQADGHTIPGVDLDLSQCIDIEATCDAERDALAAYTANSIIAFNEFAKTAHLQIPAVPVAECPVAE